MAFLLPFVGEEEGIDLENANNGRDFKLFIFAYWSLMLQLRWSVTDFGLLFDGLSLGRLESPRVSLCGIFGVKSGNGTDLSASN
jgi:hypothetical protein